MSETTCNINEHCKISKKTLQAILCEKTMAFSEKEIHEIIDLELEKSPNEMDVDFINLCLDTLEYSVPYVRTGSEE